MILVACIVGAAVLGVSAAWVIRRFERWHEDRLKLLEQLAELSEEVSLLEQNSSQAIVKFESTGVIRALNPAAEKLFGYAAEELVGQDIVNLARQAALSAELESLEIACKDGTRLILPFTSARSKLMRRSYVYFCCIYLFFEPLPPRHETEEIPPEAGSDLSFASAIVGRIAGQYETLLTTINGYSELALMETPEASPAHQKLQEILAASKSASNLTRQLVAFSGRQFIPVEPLELNRVVMDTLSSLQRAFPYPIDFDLQPTDHALLANADFLNQVILLLSGSAAERMSAGDRLRVRTGQVDLFGPRRVESGELKPGMYGAVTISDSGRPLSAQVKRHLFEPLHEIHQDLGVDLSPIYGIIQGLGGGVDLSISDETGTTFEILLPCVSLVEVGKDAQSGPLAFKASA